MGLERLAAVIQGVKSNYDTDLFRDIIGHIENLSKNKYGSNDRMDVAFRVISDHARAISAFSSATASCRPTKGGGMF
jgi:alanyl-tRNA synthetase